MCLIMISIFLTMYIHGHPEGGKEGHFPLDFRNILLNELVI